MSGTFDILDYVNPEVKDRLIIRDDTTDKEKQILAGHLFQNVKEISSNHIVKDIIVPDYDFDYTFIIDSSLGNVTLTLPELSKNINREVFIYHAKTAVSPNIATIATDVANPNTLTSDGLATIELPRVGNYIKLIGSELTGKWESLGERITSQLILDTFAGWGSVDNKISQYTNVQENIGNMFTHNHPSYNGGTEGLEIEIKRSNRYALIFAHMASSGNPFFAWSRDSGQLTTDVTLINVANRFPMDSATPGYNVSTSFTGWLKKNNICRTHGRGFTVGNPQFCMVVVAYLGS